MAICLKIPYYFYTNLNFQRPISHLILIWDPLKFHHSCTLQIKLSNFDRSTAPPARWNLYIIYPLNKKWAYKAYFCEIYGHLLNNSLLFLYKLKFSDYVSLNIDLGPIKVHHFWTLQIKLSNFARSTPQLDGSLHYLTNKQKKLAYKAYFCEIYGHLLKNSLLFLYKFKFSEAYISCLILIWDPLNIHHFWTLQIKLSNFDRSSPSIKMGLYIIYPINKEMGLPSLFCEIYGHLLKIPYYFYTNWNFQRPISHLILIWDPLKFSIIFGLCRSNWATLADLVYPIKMSCTILPPTFIFTSSIQ